MNPDRELIHFHPETVNELLGEVHDPAEESELVFKIRTLPRAEARKMAREHGVPWKVVMSNRHGNR